MSAETLPVKERGYDIEYYRKIPKIEPTSVTDEDLGVDFTKSVKTYLSDVKYKLDRLPMLLRPSGSYAPTSQEKLDKLMDSEIEVTSYGLIWIRRDVSSLKLSPCYSKTDENKRMTVKEFIPQGFEITVKSEQDVLEAEVDFWQRFDECSRAGKTNNNYMGGQDDDDETRNDHSIISRYGSDNEGSLYDHRSSGFNMLRFPNILPQVLHRYMETVDGVTTPFLYIGEEKSFFVPHVEDKDLWSINYSHIGNPKIWYCLEVVDHSRMERALARDIAAYIRGECEGCEVFLRHKAIMFHPELAKRHGIVVRKIIQEKGDIVLIPPRVIHFGFSTGPNIGEAINFQMPESLPFGYHANFCQKKEELHPTFEMEWFVLEKEPERYKDFINGKMNVIEPVSGDDINVPPPIVKKTLKEDHTGLIAGGIWEILAAKHQNAEDLLYINSPAGFSWITRQFAETLEWNKKGEPTSVKLYDELFSMHPLILQNMSKVSTCLREGNDDELFKLFARAGLRDPLPVPNQVWNPSKYLKCPYCEKSYEGYSSASTWSRHISTCSKQNLVTCEVCGKQMRQDFIKRHMEIHNNPKNNQGVKRVHND